MIRLPRPSQKAIRGVAAISEYILAHKEYFTLEANTKEERRDVETFLRWVRRLAGTVARHEQMRRNPWTIQGFTLVTYKYCPQIQYRRGKRG